MSQLIQLRGATFIALAAAAGAIAAYAGPLDPPAGPVTSSYKTLTETEPRIIISDTTTPGDSNSRYRISAPGSYYLAGNVTGVSAKSGIEIAASNVTIDLMGFDLRGVSGSLGGIVNSGSVSNIVIRNGSVGGWSAGGVVIVGNGVFSCENLNVGQNTGNGISFDTGRVEGCTSFSNTGTGIRIVQGGTITRCFAKSNGGVGIDAGIIASVTHCTSENNTGNGFNASGNSVVTQCSSQQNTGAGFSLDFSSILTDSCSRANSGAGVDAKGGSVVRDCTVDRNSLDGILAANRCMITNNSVTLNGQDFATAGAGIRATGNDNRIEGNNCIQNDHGIRVDAPGNFIRANSCSASAFVNYLFEPDNIYGVIVDRRTPASAAVSGHSAASTLGTTDPHANFSY